ncbi:MAG: ABC transporter ATP-binding protein [Burkholderiaceae bacterium]|nr:ABC transporter ATP-binding protein [Rhodoferax sp.]MCP5285805.1 ABC transporter ATP-binding protein [Burkholderiaceae bacterium]
MIELQNLTKWFPSPQGRRYVFQDLSFRFPADASIGLIGRNGAGKSTLMNLLGGIDSPNEGRIVSDARISWPVGLGGGFQVALSARENAQFVCRVYGATGPRMKRLVAFVRDFAELGDYFDMPIRTYSSGMRSRFAFGLSMAFDFDYYLIDEVMAVGDEQFRTKSRAVLAERLKHSRIVLVSHRMRDVREYCDKVVLIDGGQAKVFDDVEAGIAAYEKLVPPRQKPRRERLRPKK